MNGRMVNIYLDDVRPAPEGWLHARTAWECIAMLGRHPGRVRHLSLDHDLGEEQCGHSGPGSGYDVTSWLEGCAFDGKLCYLPMFVRIHSDNPVGRKNMSLSLRKAICYADACKFSPPTVFTFLPD